MFSVDTDTEYVTFQYQPDSLYCGDQSFQNIDLSQTTITYEIPVVEQEFSDPSSFVQLQVLQGVYLTNAQPIYIISTLL